jgi:hypothetical protein
MNKPHFAQEQLAQVSKLSDSGNQESQGVNILLGNYLITVLWTLYGQIVVVPLITWEKVTLIISYFSLQIGNNYANSPTKSPEFRPFTGQK